LINPNASCFDSTTFHRAEKQIVAARPAKTRNSPKEKETRHANHANGTWFAFTNECGRHASFALQELSTATFDRDTIQLEQPDPQR
jgi:hypothetical protein